MRYRPEPAADLVSSAARSAPPRSAVLLVNLGSPAAPTAPALRRYLAEFLSDPRVVEIPRLLWLPLLYGVILWVRPRRSAAKYASIWSDAGAPLVAWTARQAEGVGARLRALGHDVTVRHAMRYGAPSLPATLDALRATGVERIAVLPLYPQYAAATSGSVFDKVAQWALHARQVPELRFVGAFHTDVAYIEALAESLRAHWRAHGRAERLLLSFHGLPERSRALGDPYHAQCLETARRLTTLLELAPDAAQVTFQSRFGKARWLEPYTEPTLIAWARSGVRSVDVLCPGFASDCLETLEEIAQEARAAFLAAGGAEFRYVPCLNDSPAWLDALAALAERQLAGWDTRRT